MMDTIDRGVVLFLFLICLIVLFSHYYVSHYQLQERIIDYKPVEVETRTVVGDKWHEPPSLAGEMTGDLTITDSSGYLTVTGIIVTLPSGQKFQMTYEDWKSIEVHVK